MLYSLVEMNRAAMAPLRLQAKAATAFWTSSANPARETQVVEAQQVKECRVEIVDVDRFIDGGPAKIIGFAYDLSAAYATTSDPGTEGTRVMVAAITALG